MTSRGEFGAATLARTRQARAEERWPDALDIALDVDLDVERAGVEIRPAAIFRED